MWGMGDAEGEGRRRLLGWDGEGTRRLRAADRGYENFMEKLMELGAKVELPGKVLG